MFRCVVTENTASYSSDLRYIFLNRDIYYFGSWISGVIEM